MVYPIKTQPVYKQYLWGGDTLKTKFNKNIPDNFASESWEISCHDDGLCIISNGCYKGKTLKETVFSSPKEFLGREGISVFPLLVKFLDAKQKLSVQVHPDNEFAYKYENGELGKTEMWYVVDAAPGAKLVYGLKKGTGEAELFESAQNGTLENYLNYVPVKKGDAFFIPSGTIHAICEGLLIAEIQQSSNTTYRVYDYNRIDSQGNKRPLHIEKAVKATDYSVSYDDMKIYDSKEIDGGVCKVLASCEYFTVTKYDVKSEILLQKPDNRFEMLVFTEGEGEIEYNGSKENFRSGDSFFIPAAIKDYSVIGKCEFLLSYE